MNFPPTKLSRESLNNAFKEHGIKVLESRTRNEVARPRGVDPGTYYKHRRHLRKVVYDIDLAASNDAVERAIDDVKVLLTLHKYTKRQPPEWLFQKS